MRISSARAGAATSSIAIGQERTAASLCRRSCARNFSEDALRHVRTPDGAWYGGFAAWLEVLTALPKWRWLGGLLGLFVARLGSQSDSIT